VRWSSPHSKTGERYTAKCIDDAVRLLAVAKFDHLKTKN